MQISWQAQHFVNLEVHISWPAQHFVNLDAQISWQVQHFCELQSVDFVPGPGLAHSAGPVGAFLRTKQLLYFTLAV